VNITNANSDNTNTSMVVAGRNNDNCKNKNEVEKKALNEDQVLKEGWLYKKKSSFFKSWKVRFGLIDF